VSYSQLVSCEFRYMLLGTTTGGSLREATWNFRQEGGGLFREFKAIIHFLSEPRASILGFLYWIRTN
jgi:hypothetical protein